ncbi:energy-dependent translational throttle protein EttA [Gryllotalpicola reticulitermitis]|uniref:Energy-dependent translational throttle protein EttA n=1 Tax=Gryllotalpicola reticulitermitis TaxID=1184153 RepID=A0ABV8Q3I5_9MICO
MQLGRVRVVKDGRVVLDDITLGFFAGAKIGVVGPNGAGKSTLLAVIAGTEQPESGDVVATEGARIGLLAQEPVLNEDSTVLENVEEAVEDTLAVLLRFKQTTDALAVDYSDERMRELGELQDELDRLDAWDLDVQLQQAMHALRCPPGDALVRDLSGGERRRVALCRLLLQQPEVLLLDEPTNHLDADSVAWLEQHLQGYPGTVIAVTHDRYFLNNVAEWILEIDRGRAYVYQGNYATYLETKGARMAVEGKKDVKRQRRLQDELDWVRSSAQGRHRKSASRLARYEQMAAEAESTRKLDFEEIQIPPGPRLGSKVIDVTHLCKGFDGRLLFDDLSFSLPQNGIVGVLGPNGVGKTTLFEMLTGHQHPDAGAISVGETVRMSYVDQNRAGINGEQTAWEAVSDGDDILTVGRVEIPSRAYLAAFGFKGAIQQKPVRLFSGGERNRLNLALTLKQGGNVLLLDEPSNDLDTETLASLEHALDIFPGCAVITSHDRWFLDRIATHILAWEGTAEAPASWRWFEGNYADYEADRLRRLGAGATQSRVPYRKLVRS